MSKQFGIVKRFGGIDNYTGEEHNYGFISRDSMDDIYFHRNQIQDAKTIAVGTPVTFLERYNAAKDKTEAVEVTSIDFNKATSMLLEQLFESSNRLLWEKAYSRHIANLPVQDSAKMVSQKLKTLKGPDRTEFLALLADEVKYASSEMRSLLPVEEQYKWIKKVIQENNEHKFDEVENELAFVCSRLSQQQLVDLYFKTSGAKTQIHAKIKSLTVEVLAQRAKNAHGSSNQPTMLPDAILH